MAANLVEKSIPNIICTSKLQNNCIVVQNKLPVDTILHLYVDDKYRYMYIVDQCTYVYQGLA